MRLRDDGEMFGKALKICIGAYVAFVAYKNVITAKYTGMS